MDSAKTLKKALHGIGMKRSIFKIGSDFEVQSKTDSDSFIVYMNKDEWLTLMIL